MNIGKIAITGVRLSVILFGLTSCAGLDELKRKNTLIDNIITNDSRMGETPTPINNLRISVIQPKNEYKPQHPKKEIACGSHLSSFNSHMKYDQFTKTRSLKQGLSSPINMHRNCENRNKKIREYNSKLEN